MTPRHENIAASLQVVTEEIIFHLLNRLHEDVPKTSVPRRRLCDELGGQRQGDARDAVRRGVHSGGAADNGTSFGAAFHVWHRVLGQPRSFVQDHAFWGCEATADECEAAVRDAGLPYEPTRRDRSWSTASSSCLLAGKVVGWFQDRMEFGARALGSRSLLADPRRTDMRDIINLKIKFREKFRPFAPSILEEYVGECFEVDEPSPFMERVLPIRPEKRPLIPGGDARRRQRAAADGLAADQSVILGVDRAVPPTDGRADAPQHVAQRE